MGIVLPGIYCPIEQNENFDREKKKLALHGEGKKVRVKTKNPRASVDVEFKFESDRALRSLNLQVLHKTKHFAARYQEKTLFHIFITFEATKMKTSK